MDIPNYIQILKNLQYLILQYIDEVNDVEEKYHVLINKLCEYKIIYNQDDFRLFLRLISQIAKNHHRTSDFFGKIEKILQYLKNEIKQTFSNSQIFQIFKKNKNILLFLIEENMLIIDQSIVEKMGNFKYKYKNYEQFFFPEIKKFLDISKIKEIESKIPENFEEKRRIGQNDEFICEIIRKDSINEFIEYINKTNLQINSKIKNSIFETNHFLLSKYFLTPSTTLIEYAAFFGSLNIFNYLFNMNAETEPELLIYSVHSNNKELIHIVENIKFEKRNKRKYGYYSDSDYEIPYYGDMDEEEQKDNSHEKSFEECVKCHHDEIAVYIAQNWSPQNLNQLVSYCFRYCNFLLIQNDYSHNAAFYNCCKYEYITLVNLFFKTNVDVNAKTIIDDEIANQLIFEMVFKMHFLLKLLWML